MDKPNLTLPDNFINRELSALEFNSRVLAQARDHSIPILERLKFLCIVSTNFDEFFEIRVSGLQQRLESGASPSGPDMLSSHAVLKLISERAHELVEKQYEALNNEILPELENQGLHFIRRQRWTSQQRAWLREHFFSQIAPVLSPISLDPGRPFPRILNKSLNFIVGLRGAHAFGRPCTKAIVQAPRSLPRLIRLPSKLEGTGEYNFVFLSAVMHAFIDELFRGMEITGCYQFRVTRNSDLYVDPEEVDDLKRVIEGELMGTRYGAAVRLEIARGCPDDLTRYLLDMFGLDHQDLYEVNGPVNLNRLLAVYDLVQREDLKDAPFTPSLPSQLANAELIFDTIADGEVLLHHPYESFTPVLELINQAAIDPNVLAIKMTLYRAGANSPIINSLVTAAETGKEVTVSIELRARFDEAANIKLANRLQEAGAHVVYGIVGFKTHCKMALIVRREQDHLRRYVHLGTGNYHPGTARVYTDYGLLSANEQLGIDVHEVFMQLTSMMQTPPLHMLYEAPFGLHERILEHIETEIKNAKAGGAGHIIAKLNALVEPKVIEALYRASCAGVFIDLIVRGICCLRPGIPGISTNIRVRSIIGRFLEHSRAYYFYANGEEKVFCASADWMDRNFFQRIEVAFPIHNDTIKRRLISDLDTYLSDNIQAWELQSNGQYTKVGQDIDEDPVSAQMQLLTDLTDSPQSTQKN
ncbi:MAG: polyphosphate kinase 1 [Gammaproteobacteria bacterium]|nr:polyphosphate kinase 1 [Gammaproteobacteria bacterium]